MKAKQLLFSFSLFYTRRLLTRELYMQYNRIFSLILLTILVIIAF